MKLLIVEDNKAFRGFLSLWAAEQAGENVPDVFEAATLADAIRIVREETVDAVLSDEAFRRIGAITWAIQRGGRTVV